MSLPTNDLLSAFHDGEANSAERVAVERCLAESAEARRELSETRQVSSLLKELPRERLPVEFPQQVLQAIEREMLIPSLPSGSDALPPTAHSLRRWIGAAAVLTSAAGLLLLVRAIDERPAREFASAPRSASAPTKFSLDSSTSVAATAPLAADAVADDRQAAGGFGGGAAAKSVAMGAAAGAGPSPASVASRESDALFFDQSSLKDAKIGDVVRAMQTEGTEVAVVWLTVVDRQEGLAGLQFLLADNRIARAETNSKAAETRKAKSTKPKANSDQMHAVFVESDAEHLAAALKQLRDQSFVQSLEVDQPIELAQLEDAGAGVDSMLATRRSMTTTDPAKKIAAAPAPLIAPKSGPTRSKADSAVTEQLAQQTMLEVPRETLLQNSLNQQFRNRSNIRNAPRAAVADEKSADKATAEQRPMQVLFVIVDQTQAGKSASPNNAPKANPPAKARTKPAKPNGQDGAA